MDDKQPHVLPNKRSRYFFTASLIAFAIVLIGFFKTFIVPSFQRTFEAPLVIYLHGGFLILWSLFFIAQTLLIRKRFWLHRLFGFSSLVLVVCVMISTIAAGVYVMKRDIAAGLGEVAISTLVGAFMTPLVFSILVAAGILYRRKPEIHKRLMLLAMIAILWPAFFRFRHYFPSVPNPELVFGLIVPDSMILLAVLWEKLSVKRVHPVYFTAGLALFAENLTEVLLFDSPGWRIVAHWLAGFFI
ncbi:hypothetical protein BH10ACI2_BH10ACI2_26200 [soil metagenome]